MERAAVPASTSAVVAFQDGLGERRQVLDTTGAETLELLCLREEISAVPSFEFALRERVSRLANFRQPHYGRVRTVERLNDSKGTLAIVSERVPGIRLSEMLRHAEERRLAVDITTALGLIRQLVPAIAALHETSRDIAGIAHGAIGPERLVVTPNARLIVVEYVMGAALEQLHYSQERYWSELRIAVPRSAGLPRFDQRADMTQIGMVALSLILGRLLRDDEYPARIAEVVASTWAVSARGGFEPLPPGLRGWLNRALQLEARTAFGSAVEAQSELDKILSDADHRTGPPAGLEAFLARYNAAERPSTDASPAASVPVVVTASTKPEWAAPAKSVPAAAPPVVKPAPAVAPPIVKPGPAVAPPVVRPAPAVAPPSTWSTPAVASPVAWPTPPVAPASVRPEPPAAPAPATALPPFTAVPAGSDVRPAFTRPAPGFAVTPPPPEVTAPVRPSAPLPLFRPEPVADQAPVVEIGSLAESVNVRPSASASLRVSPPRPERPERPLFEPAARVTEFELEEEAAPSTRWLRPAAIAVVVLALAGAGLFAARSLFTSAPGEVATGTLTITTSPSGARAVVDGEARGVTPMTLTLSPGPHVIELQGAGEPRSIPVTIAAGSNVSQHIELPRAAAPLTGQLQVLTEPPGARVTVDGVPAGISPTTVPDLKPGEHTVVLESDLGVVQHAVTIEAGAMASLVVPLAAAAAGPASGWIAVAAPVDVEMYEQDQMLGTNQTDRIMVPAGRHEITFVNEGLGYRSTRVVEVGAGEVAAVRLEMPQGAISLNAEPWAQVWIDGESVGETPIGNLAVPIGKHDVVFRHPEFGEQHHTVTVTLSEITRLSVDLRKP